MAGTEVGIQQVTANPETAGVGRRWKDVLLGVALAIAVFAVYYPVHHYPFVDIDDSAYVYDDPHVMGPLNLATVEWAFSHYFVDNYVPLDLLSHNLDAQLFGLNAGGHHDVNVLLHVLNALLLFWVLKRATGYTGRSAMVAALFALHPINVENVAWIAERKTMLSTLFFLLAMGAYRWYVSNPKERRMAVVAVLFTLGLLAKPQVIAFPFVLLLWDYWPLRRTQLPTSDAGTTATVGQFQPRKFTALLEEKIPLFIIAFADALITMHSESGMEHWNFPLYLRMGNAILSYAKYIGMAFWPHHLALMYLHPGFALPWAQVGMAFLFLIAITALVLAKRKQGYLVVGWLWFLGTMVPTIGIVQIDVHALADRYAYVAFVGLFLMICWSVAEWVAKLSLPKALLPVASVVVLLALSVTTRHQVGFWSDRVTLWNHTLDVTHRNWVADVRLGNYYGIKGDNQTAIFHYSRAAEDRPNNAYIDRNLAMLEHRSGNLRQAIVYYEKALAEEPDSQQSAQLFANLGHAYGELGDSANALRCYRSAQRLSGTTPTSTSN